MVRRPPRSDEMLAVAANVGSSSEMKGDDVVANGRDAIRERLCRNWRRKAHSAQRTAHSPLSAHDLPQYQIGDELLHPRIVLLRQPEERLASHTRVAVMPRDVDERIGRGVVLTL